MNEDIFSEQLYIKLTSQTRVDFASRLDFSSISSNFSTNSKIINPPGVVGRHDERKVYFPEINFNPQLMVNVQGSLLLLSKNKRTAYNFLYSTDYGFELNQFLFNDYMKLRPEIVCSDMSVSFGRAIFICYNEAVYNKQVSGLDLKYTLIIVDMATTKIALSVEFEGYKIEFPRVIVNKFEDNADYLVVMIMPHMQKTLTGKRAEFKSQSRIILATIKVVRDGDEEKMFLEDSNIFNLEEKILGTHQENFSLIDIKMKNNNFVYVHYGKCLLLLNVFMIRGSLILSITSMGI